MGRRQKKEEQASAGAPLWMVTYSDMVTLLLTFFVMLIAMANFEQVGRVQAVFQSIRLALGVGGAHELLQPDHLLERRCKRTRPVRPEAVGGETARAAGEV